MSYIIAVYRSRNVCTRVFSQLHHNGFNVALISTPQSANVGCGLSLKMSSETFDKTKSFVSTVETFVGFFKVTVINGKSIVTRI